VLFICGLRHQNGTSERILGANEWPVFATGDRSVVTLLEVPTTCVTRRRVTVTRTRLALGSLVRSARVKIDFVELTPRALLRVRKKILAWIEIDVAIPESGYTSCCFEMLSLSHTLPVVQRGEVCFMVAYSQRHAIKSFFCWQQRLEYVSLAISNSSSLNTKGKDAVSFLHLGKRANIRYDWSQLGLKVRVTSWNWENHQGSGKREKLA
jgi:hypothetical protein